MGVFSPADRPLTGFFFNNHPPDRQNLHNKKPDLVQLKSFLLGTSKDVVCWEN
jgi:hypothetical protein